jgi:hypothetical protein
VELPGGHTPATRFVQTASSDSAPDDHSSPSSAGKCPTPSHASCTSPRPAPVGPPVAREPSLFSTPTAADTPAAPAEEHHIRTLSELSTVPDETDVRSANLARLVSEASADSSDLQGLVASVERVSLPVTGDLSAVNWSGNEVYVDPRPRERTSSSNVATADAISAPLTNDSISGNIDDSGALPHRAPFPTPDGRTPASTGVATRLLAPTPEVDSAAEGSSPASPIGPEISITGSGISGAASNAAVAAVTAAAPAVVPNAQTDVAAIEVSELPLDVQPLPAPTAPAASTKPTTMPATTAREPEEDPEPPRARHIVAASSLAAAAARRPSSHAAPDRLAGDSCNDLDSGSLSTLSISGHIGGHFSPTHTGSDFATGPFVDGIIDAEVGGWFNGSVRGGGASSMGITGDLSRELTDAGPHSMTSSGTGREPRTFFRNVVGGGSRSGSTASASVGAASGPVPPAAASLSPTPPTHGADSSHSNTVDVSRFSEVADTADLTQGLEMTTVLDDVSALVTRNTASLEISAPVNEFDAPVVLARARRVAG